MNAETKKVLTVRNNAQKLLFERELLGQISDGLWENSSPHNHWEVFDDVTVVVGKDVGVNFTVKRSYNFADSELLEVVGDRMLEIVRESGQEYSEQEMVNDLNDLSRILKIKRCDL